MITRATLLAFVALGLAHPVSAQDLMERITSVDDGTVRIAFPTRAGVCGWGENVRFNSGTRDDNADWEPDCESGPARVVIRRSYGRTVDIDTYVGGRWRPRSDVMDLGTVTGRAAVDLFLSMAEQFTGEVAKDAIYPAALADADAFPRLVTLAQDRDRPSDVREQAVFWVGQIGGAEAVDVLVGMLDDPDDAFREKVIFALSQTGSEDGFVALRAVVLDPEMPSGSREKAIFWLGQSRSDATIGFLREAFDSMRDIELREQIIFAMSQQNDEANATWLVRDVVLADGMHRDLRAKGIFWLGQMHGQSERLIGLYDRVESDELREKLIFAYSQNSDKDRLDKLIDIARNETRTDLRGKAIFWLGQSRDPRAVEVLAELIGS